MAGNPKQKLKLLYISEYLQKNTDEQHPAAVESIIAYLRTQGINAERKSIYNDIEKLKEFGMLIKHSRSSPRGYYIESGGLETGEYVMLANVLMASPVISRGKTLMLIRKLRSLVSERQSDSIDAIFDPQGGFAESFGERASFIKTENEELYKSVDAINRAIVGRKKISFIYRHQVLVNNMPVFDNGRAFTVSPYAAIWHDDRYYLVGNNEKYDDLSHYRIDRMIRAEVTDQPSRDMSEVSRFRGCFNASEYSRELFNMYSGGKRMRVTLVCADELLETMVERFGRDLRYRQLPGKRFSLTTDVCVSEGFINWLFGFGEAVTAESPPELCDMIKQRLTAMRSNY